MGPGIRKKQNRLELIKAATQQFQVACGTFFKEKRILRNKTEEEVAEYLKVPVSEIRDYESGKKAIPLFRVDALSSYLGIPPEEIVELHLNLEKGLVPKPLFEDRYIHGKNVGDIVQQARRTVNLSSRSLAQLLSESGHRISENEIAQIENGDKQVTVDFWLAFCTLTHLHLDAVEGYSKWEHLARLNVAYQNQELCVPAGPKLLKALEEYHSAKNANDYKVSYLLKFSVAYRGEAQRGRWLRKN